MNLADIRKKAQQEKSEPLREEKPAGGKRETQPAEPDSDGPVPSSWFPEPAVEAPSSLSPFGMNGSSPASFDPLAVLLAGRTIAGCDDEIPIDAGADEETAVKDFQEFLCFRVSDEFYAISIMEIKEIIKPREITEVPRVPAFISGVLSLRGIIIPVFNMHVRLGLEGNSRSGKERIVVVRKGEEFAGVLVDEVIQVVKIMEGAIEPPPAVLEGVDRDFVHGIGRYDGRMLILLNLKNVLDLTLC